MLVECNEAAAIGGVWPIAAFLLAAAAIALLRYRTAVDKRAQRRAARTVDDSSPRRYGRPLTHGRWPGRRRSESDRMRWFLDLSKWIVIVLDVDLAALREIRVCDAQRGPLLALSHTLAWTNADVAAG